MDFKAEKSEGKLTISITGRLDAVNKDIFEEYLTPYLDRIDSDMTLDFANVDFVSSGGLRIILKALKKVNESGKQLMLVNVVPTVYNVLVLSGFHNFLQIHTKES